MRGLDKDQPTPIVSDAMKIVLMIGDIRLAAEQIGVAGDVYILDASVATPTHFAKFTPSVVKKFLVCVQVSIYFLIFRYQKSKNRELTVKSLNYRAIRKIIVIVGKVIEYVTSKQIKPKESSGVRTRTWSKSMQQKKYLSDSFFTFISHVLLDTFLWDNPWNTFIHPIIHDNFVILFLSYAILNFSVSTMQNL